MSDPHADIRQGTLRIQKGAGTLGIKCGYCYETIGSHQMEVTNTRFPYGHWHLDSSEPCEGWIFHNWGFITTLLHKLTDIGGDDYDEFIDMLIKLWEEEP